LKKSYRLALVNRGEGRGASAETEERNLPLRPEGGGTVIEKKEKLCLQQGTTLWLSVGKLKQTEKQRCKCDRGGGKAVTIEEKELLNKTSREGGQVPKKKTMPGWAKRK